MNLIQKLISHYHLQPHPEGGWYRQTYKSDETIAADALPERFGGSRSFYTAIYFLLAKGDFSAFHRIKSDECWHFYAGGPLHIYIIKKNGELEMITMGNDIAKGQLFQFVVPAGCWFASRPASGSEFCFAGCTVSPGFEFEDFELADANKLCKTFPLHAEIIKELCR